MRTMSIAEVLRHLEQFWSLRVFYSTPTGLRPIYWFVRAINASHKYYDSYDGKNTSGDVYNQKELKGFLSSLASEQDIVFRIITRELVSATEITIRGL